MRSTLFPILLVSGLALNIMSAAAQELPTIRAADTSSPRDTLKSFIDACNELHQRIRSLKYLDRDSPEDHPLGMRILDCLDQKRTPRVCP